MNKKVGLILLSGVAVITPSCGRKVLRKVAAQLVATYTHYEFKDEELKVDDVIDNVTASWTIGEKGKETSRNLIKYLTGDNNPSTNQDFTAINKKSFIEDTDGSKVHLNKWNLYSAVFDDYFPENMNIKYTTQRNDLFIEGQIAAGEIACGNGNYHYDSYGRLLNASMHLDKIKFNSYNDDSFTEIDLNYNIIASYK